LLATTSGVFRLDGDHLVRIGGDQILGVGYPGFYSASDDTLLIGTTHGVFRRDGDRLIAIGQDTYADRMMRFYTAHDGTLPIGDSKGVLRRDGDKLVAIGRDQTPAPIKCSSRRRGHA
jgi:hypothetical protein